MPFNASRAVARLSAVSLAVAALPTFAASAVVPGNANPNLAGRAPGYACCAGDTVANESPTLVAGLPLLAGQILTFDVTGQVSHTGSASGGNNPDGEAYGAIPGHYGDGIASPINVNRINALVGLFLGAGSPTGAATPAQLDYAGNLAFTSTSPLIGQVFFIGNGRTGDTLAGDFGGGVQTFTVPTGATRLYLGTSDGYGWYNNNGAFNVTINAVPEPASMLMLLAGAGLASIAGGRTRRSR